MREEQGQLFPDCPKNFLDSFRKFKEDLLPKLIQREKDEKLIRFRVAHQRQNATVQFQRSE